MAASGVAGIAQSFVTVDRAPQIWWTRFQSDELNRLVNEALQHSPTLAQAHARLTEAQENYNAQAGATLFPAVDARLSATRQKPNLAALGIPNVPNPGPFTVYNASVSVSYVLDVFGGNRRALEATMAQVDYQAFELEAARLTLAGNVVSTAIRRASVARQIELTRPLVDAQAVRAIGTGPSAALRQSDVAGLGDAQVQALQGSQDPGEPVSSAACCWASGPLRALATRYGRYVCLIGAV